MATTYTVKKGDTLSEIAVANNTTVSKLVELNGITNPNYIVVGQVIKLTGSSSGGSSSGGSSSGSTTNTTAKPNVNVFGLQSGTDRTIYASWVWSKSNTKEYQVVWEYNTGDPLWFIGTDSTVTEKQSLYSAPENAKLVRFKVKPISESRTVNNNETKYWTASWSSYKTYDFSDAPPLKPSAPNVEIENYKLTAKLENIDEKINATKIQFQVVKNNSTVFTTGLSTITTNYAAFSCTIDVGAEYKVRCRANRDKEYGEWSEYSNNCSTMPAVPSGLTTCKATSESSVYLEWAAVNTAESYDIEYTTKKEYFDGSDKTTTSTGIKSTHYEKTGLETGEEYFFRVRAVNDGGTSGWSEISSIIIGKKPSAPTTWSSTTIAIVGEPLNLYWVHNAVDGSSQTSAELELNMDGAVSTKTIQNTRDEDEKDKTSVYAVDTLEYQEGSVIKWRVRTAGITGEYGEWSVQRTVDVYAPPVLELNVSNVNGEFLETLESFPINVTALAGPNTQKPIGYHLTILSNSVYETVNSVGNTQIINAGEEVYSKYFDASGKLSVKLSAGDVNLENNIEYTIACTVAMDSGLSTEAKHNFIVSWTDDIYDPDAEITIDEETLAAYIRPYCIGGDSILSVYRMEFDGGFTEIASGLDSRDDAFITDPHPALDYARYRIVAISQDTGAISYYDMPGYPIGEKAIVIQWDEVWNGFDTDNEDALEQPAWAGSMLKLPYNIDVSDKNTSDVSLIKYIGRKHPVSYYGTQIGTTSTWQTVIPKSDRDTIYALRRLAVWTGDVYVREPSGTGYWATISVSFNLTHCKVDVPVTIDVTRVEGGV